MIKPLRLVVRTPAETIVDAVGVLWIRVQLSDGGSIGIRPGHAPLLAETITAPLKYADEAGEHSLGVEAGILQIAREAVTIYTSGSTTVEPPAAQPDAVAARFDRLAQMLLAALDDGSEGELKADAGE